MLPFRMVGSVLPHKMSRPEPEEPIDLLCPNRIDLRDSLAQCSTFIDKKCQTSIYDEKAA